MKIRDLDGDKRCIWKREKKLEFTQDQRITENVRISTNPMDSVDGSGILAIFFISSGKLIYISR